MSSEQATDKFYQIVWPQRSDVLRLAQILTGNAAEADDLAQETLLKAFSAIDRFEEGTNVKAWLMRILRNTRIDRLRASGKESRNVSLEALSYDPVDDGQFVDEQWQEPQELLNTFADQEVIEALQCLPEEIRWTLLLVDVEGLDQQEAATMLGVPVGTIKSRAHRGRGMLREALLPLAREMRLVG